MGLITQRKGDIGVAQAIATFTRMGMNVFLPIGEGLAYDFVVDNDGALFRVQARYTSGRAVELRRVYSNTKGSFAKKVPEGAYDWLYVLNGANEEFLIKENLAGRSSIIPKPEHQINGE